MEGGIELLRRLGGLHDAEVEEVVWCKADRSLRLTIANIPATFEEGPDHPDPASGVVTFVGIDGVAVETALFRGVFRISGIEVERRADHLEARIGLSEPGSDLRLSCTDITVTIHHKRKGH
jgi:hypothetical protein